MGENVTLHLYDLSNGLAAQLSLQLTGKYIPAVWHSAVVVFGEEVYFGQGICRARPGQTHHGLPHKTIHLGETQLDKETFEEYLTSLSEVYTADKYHLLDFNCNNFTNDVTGFLTGGQIPQDVIDLPKEFLSTPFGASLKPMIDDMFRRSGAGPQSAPTNGHSMPNGIPSGLVQQIAQAAQGQVAASSSGQSNGTHTPQRPVASSLSVATNMASFNSILNANKCVAVMFTGEWCGPCKTVKPVFENLAQRSTSQPPVAFVLVDTSAGREVAEHYGISAVPTFKFFLSGKQTHEIKGADAHELKTQVEILAMTGYPAHPHLKLKMPTLGNMSLSPVLYEQKPNCNAAMAKLDSFRSVSSDTTKLGKALEQAKPSLKLLSDPEKLTAAQTQNVLKQVQPLLQSLEPEQFFPLFDILRYAVLQSAFAEAVAESLGSAQDNLILSVLERSSQEASLPKASLVTLLRLLCNCFSSPILGSRLLVDPRARQGLCRILVQALLEADKSVRVAAGSLAYNVAARLRKQRKTWVDEDQAAHQAFEDQEDFEIELCSALLEALDRENTLEVAHRLLASLGQLLLFSSYFEAGLSPVVQALEGKRIVQSKKGVLQGNAEACKLITEVSQLADS